VKKKAGKRKERVGESTPEINSWSRPCVGFRRWRDGKVMKGGGGRERRGKSERGKSSHFSKRFDASVQQTPPLFQQRDFLCYSNIILLIFKTAYTQV